MVKKVDIIELEKDFNMKASQKAPTADPLNIELINEQCGYCFECGKIEYKDRLVEMGTTSLSKVELYICQKCLNGNER